MRILIIQTAFIGDVILASALVESLAAEFPNARIEFLLRKGNESLVKNNPHVQEVHIWDKKNGKYKNLFKLISRLRKVRYDHVFCLQRFGAMGYLTARLKADVKSGFKKNPFSFAFTHKAEHDIESGKHEIERNLELTKYLGTLELKRPALYPSKDDLEKVKSLESEPYTVIAPNSVWFTKQAPIEFWLKLVKQLKHKVYLIGAPSDKARCQEIIDKSGDTSIGNLCGELSLLESAALIQGANMVYSCDSAPMHIASAMNTPCKAIYCSTVPSFGFGPLSDDKEVIEVSTPLDCRPCGLHGYKSCPKSHFKCGTMLTEEI